MSAKRVEAAARVIHAEMEQGRQSAGSFAAALESARLLMSPEVAAELERLRSEVESSRVDSRRLIRAEQRRAELEAVLGTHRKDDRAEIERMRARVAELEAKPLVDRERVELLAGFERALSPFCEDPKSAAAAVVGVRDPEAEWLLRDAERLQARVVELEAERTKYVGKEPTIAEEMAYLSRCIDAVLDLCNEAEREGITSGGSFTVEAVRRAADGLVERRSYPPALPWAALMDDEDLHDFLDELAASAITHASNAKALAEVEATCGRWRLIAEAQHAHNTAPGPSAEESADRWTAFFAPTQAYREDEAAGVPCSKCGDPVHWVKSTNSDGGFWCHNFVPGRVLDHFGEVAGSEGRHVFEKERLGESDAKRRLARCKHCGQDREAPMHAESGGAR